MNRKRIWFFLPAALLPYVTLCALAVISFSTKHPIFEFIMEHMFCGNAMYVIAVLLVFAILAATTSVICFFLSIRKGWGALSLVKTAMIIKLLQVPAYVLIFILGVLFAITIFTLPFSFGLLLFDCLTLVLSGLLTIAAVINAVRQRIFTYKESVWVILLQLIFCADVVATILFFLMLRKKSSKME